MRIELKVAIIGAVAALVAAFIPLIWGWFDATPRNQPATVTLTAAPLASPYQSYSLSEVPPAFVNVEAKPQEGFYLWPEADLTELLPILSLGAGETPQLYPEFSDIEDDSDAERNDHLERVWSVIEMVGYEAEKSLNAVPSGLTNPDGSALFDANAPTSEIGLTLLRAVYLGHETGVADASDPIVRAAIDFTRGMFLDDDRPSDDTALRTWFAARFLAQRQVYPVLDLVVANPNDEAILITGLLIDVLATAPAMSGLQTGPLDVLDTITVNLDPNGGPHPVTLSAPIRVAAKDFARLRLKVTSDVLFAFLARVDVVNGADTLGTADAFIVDLGFRPPAGSNPI